MGILNIYNGFQNHPRKSDFNLQDECGLFYLRNFNSIRFYVFCDKLEFDS